MRKCDGEKTQVSSEANLWRKNASDGIVYDIDEGIIKKKVNGRWLQLPNAVDSLSVIQDAPIANSIRPSQNYVNNQNFTFPTNEQLQSTDNKKISEDVNALNLKNKLYKTMYKIYLIMKSCHKTQAIMYQNCHRMKWIY